MKTILLIICFFLFSINSNCQSIDVTEVIATTTNGGINVNVKAVSGNGAGYLSHSYTFVGNTINLNVCYWFNFTLPVLFFENDFFIPITNSGNYTLNVYGINSSSVTVCDNYSVSPVETITVSYLSNDEFEKVTTKIFPNPLQLALKACAGLIRKS